MHRIPIVDGEALRTVLKEIHDQEGTHQKAAEHLGIGKYTFTKLLNGTVSGMAFDTYSSILRALGGHAVERGRVVDPVLEFVADQEGEGELSRKNREAKAEAASHLYHTFKRGVLTPDDQIALAHYQEWVEQEVKRIQTEARPLFDELMDHPKSRRRFEDFLERVRGSRVLPQPEDTRCWLALYRAVEPLCAADATGGVERTWEEMDHRELKAYLKAALRREEVLMNRDRDWRRIKTFPSDQIEWIKADLAGAFEDGVLPKQYYANDSDAITTEGNIES